MFQIIDGRGTGKTNQLILLAKEYGATIVAQHPDLIIRRIKSLGINDIKIIGYRDFNNYKDGRPNEKYLIDELAMFVQYMTNGKLLGYNLSNPKCYNGDML